MIDQTTLIDTLSIDEKVLAVYKIGLKEQTEILLLLRLVVTAIVQLKIIFICIRRLAPNMTPIDHRMRIHGLLLYENQYLLQCITGVLLTPIRGEAKPTPGLVVLLSLRKRLTGFP